MLNSTCSIAHVQSHDRSAKAPTLVAVQLNNVQLALSFAFVSSNEFHVPNFPHEYEYALTIRSFTGLELRSPGADIVLHHNWTRINVDTIMFDAIHVR